MTAEEVSVKWTNSEYVLKIGSNCVCVIRQRTESTILRVFGLKNGISRIAIMNMIL